MKFEDQKFLIARKEKYTEVVCRESLHPLSQYLIDVMMFDIMKSGNRCTTFYNWWFDITSRPTFTDLWYIENVGYAGKFS